MRTVQKTPRPRRVRSVEWEAGRGWIARNPTTGAEICPGIRWASRALARAAVHEAGKLGAGTTGSAV
jgi:hypothetical protein